MYFSLFRLPLPTRLTRRRPSRGFTAVELVVTMAVLVVLLAMAAPRFADFSASNQLSATRSSFSGAVALARTEAASRGLTVFVAAVAGGATGNEFANGWEVIVDDNSDGTPGASETRVRRFAALPPAITVSGATTLAFRATGALLNPAAAQAFVLCRAGSSRGFSVTVVPSGVADVDTVSSCP